MTLSRRLVENVAICSGRVSSNNYFSMSQKDLDSTSVEPGDQVRVMMIRTDLEGELMPMDRDIYTSTVQKSNQIYIPADTRDKLDLETGDLIKYAVIPKDAFPGLSDGPVRDKFGFVGKFLSGDIDEEDDSEENVDVERPERQTTNAEFSGTMQQTGQVTVPRDVVQKMGLIQGDTVTATIRWKGEDHTDAYNIGTGNRITINKEVRDKLGLEPGDEPSIRLAVFA